jgi:hypothetical protein
MAEAAKYLVLIRLRENSRERLVALVPVLQDELAKMSEIGPELVIKSATADCFAYFILTKLEPHQIMSRLTAPNSKYSGTEVILDGRDSIFILELGKNWRSTDGFGRAATWLQRH